MAVFNKLLTPLNGTMGVQERPYVDDIFDPLFNAKVKDYYRNLYGNGFMGTMAGYADMVDNALTGGKGILGPGMGILSTFGRSMDKADDFILGGLTEGVNLVGNVLGGSNPVPSNPLENIFVNDEDYTGTRLLAAMGNSMARLAGGVQLNENDFTSLGDRTAGTIIDLATDPGILGGKLAKLYPTSPVSEVGQIMSDYDDYMANIAGNMAFPGGKYLATKGIARIHQFLGNVSGRPFQDVTYYSPDDYKLFKTMSSDYASSAKINPIDDPETFNMLEDIEQWEINASKAKPKMAGISTPRKPKDAPIEPVPPETPEMEPPYTVRTSNYRKLPKDAYYEYIKDTMGSEDDPESSVFKLNAYADQFAFTDENTPTSKYITVGDIINDYLTDHTQSKLDPDFYDKAMKNSPLSNYLKDHPDLENYLDADVYDELVRIASGDIEDVYKDAEFLDTYLPNFNKYASEKNMFNRKKHIPFQVSFSTADYRSKTYKEVQDTANGYFMDFIKKHPEEFKDLDTLTTNTMVKTMTDALKKNLTKYLFSKEDVTNSLNYVDALDSTLEKVLNKRTKWLTVPEAIQLRSLLKRKGLDSDMFRVTGTNVYVNIKDNPKEFAYLNTLSEQTRAFKNMAENKDFRTTLTANKEVFDILIDSELNNRFMPNLNRLFKEHPEDSRLSGSYKEFLDMWTNPKSGLISFAESNKSKLMLTQFGADFYETCMKIKKHALQYSTFAEMDEFDRPNPLKGFLPDVRKFTPDLTTYTKLKNELPKLDVKMSKGHQILLNGTATYDAATNSYKYVKGDLKNSTRQGRLMAFLYDAREATNKQTYYGLRTSHEIDTNFIKTRKVPKTLTAEELAELDTLSAKAAELSKSTTDKIDEDIANRIWELSQIKKTGMGTEQYIEPGKKKVFENPYNVRVPSGGAFDAESYYLIDLSNVKRIIEAVPEDANPSYLKALLLSLNTGLDTEHVVNEGGKITHSRWSRPVNLYDLLYGKTSEHLGKYFNVDIKHVPVNANDLDEMLNGLSKKDGMYFAENNRMLDIFTRKDFKMHSADEEAMIVSDLRDLTINEKSYNEYLASGVPEQWAAYKKAVLDYNNDKVLFEENKIKYEKKLKKYNNAVAKYAAAIKPSDYSQTILLPKETKFESTLIDEVFGNFKKNWNINYSNGGFDGFEHYIKEYGTTQEKRFYTLLKKASSANITAKTKEFNGKWGVYADNAVKASRQRFLDLSSKYTSKEIEEYLVESSKVSDQIIKGNDMVKYIINSGGFVSTVLVPGTDEYNKLYSALKNNVDKINKASSHGDVLRLISLEDGTLGYCFANNDKILKAFKSSDRKLFSLFTPEVSLEDMTFYKGRPMRTEIATKYADLDKAFTDLRDISNALATKMGETEFSDGYVKYVMQIDNGNPGGKFFEAYRNSMGLNDDLSLMADTLRSWDEKSVFGSPLYNRAYLGDLDAYRTKEGGIAFSTDLNEIHASTLTKGMFEDNDTQTFFGMFTGDAFKLQSNFRDVDELKKVIYAKDSSNRFVGNLDAVSLVSPKYNEAGRLVGFKRYDKLSEAALEEAMKDPNAVILPDSMWAKLDRLCKKRVRMSSRFARFLQKYVTVPFKMGTLANPGFIVGNMQDAYFKQATLMSRMYGTSLEDELANVSVAMKQVMDLNNSFTKDNGVFDTYCKFLTEDSTAQIMNAKGVQAFKRSIFAAKNKTLTPAVVMGNPEYLNEWVAFLNTKNGLSPEEMKVAKLYTFVNNFQNVAEFNNNNLDLEDAFETLNLSKYDVPDNVVDRVFYGDPSKGTQKFDTWGLFVNNPVSNTILKKSNQVETWMRSACIFNDLYHKGYTVDDIGKMLGNTGDEAIKEKLRVEMLSSINAMHASNFDYDNVSPLMDKMSYILPFPTFYLKNVSYWLDMFVEKPQLIDNVISMHEGMWSGKDTDDEFSAEAKGRGAIPIGIGNKHFTGIVKQSPYNSMFGAFNAINNAKEDFAYRTNPVLRPAARHLQDPKDVKYRPYSTDLYEKNITKGDKNFSELSYMFHQLNPYERATNTFMRTPGKLGNNTWQLSDFAPSMFQPDFSKRK